MRQVLERTLELVEHLGAIGKYKTMNAMVAGVDGEIADVRRPTVGMDQPIRALVTHLRLTNFPQSQQNQALTGFGNKAYAKAISS
jgi:hypothetical protein